MSEDFNNKLNIIKKRRLESDIKRLEELKLDLIEIKAYRDMQNDNLNLNGEIIINDSEVSEDAYYEMLEDNLNEAIEELDESIRRRTKDE